MHYYFKIKLNFAYQVLKKNPNLIFDTFIWRLVTNKFFTKIGYKELIKYVVK